MEHHIQDILKQPLFQIPDVSLCELGESLKPWNPQATGMPKVSPEVLRWARETASLPIETAASAVIGGTRALDRLQAIEEGTVEPTRNQLLAMAKRYHRPLLTFYLAKPPAPAERTHDFRRTPDRASAPEAMLEALIRDMRARQGLIRAALEESDEAEALPFVGALPNFEGVEALADGIIQTWKIDLARFRGAKSVDDAFKSLRESVERSGVFVILQGNLGHHTTNISANVFRGFTLVDPIVPFIVINETDARSAWSFTLLHELGHLLIGQSGISGYDSDEVVEKLCDEAAAFILLGPEGTKEIRIGPNISFEESVRAVSYFADTRKVSRKMVAYNLMAVGTINAAAYARMAIRFDEDRIREAQSRPKSGGGGDYFVTRRHRIGASLIRVVDRLVATE